MHDLASQLSTLAAQGLQRRRRVIASPCGTRVRLQEEDLPDNGGGNHGRELLAFASNDYLGFANHPDLVAALCAGAVQWGVGSGASHLVSGHLLPHEALEQELAAFVGFPRAITLSTGYLANLAIIPSLAGRGDAVFADKLNHASLIDAVQLARCDSQRYPHNNMAALARQLAASTAKTKLIVSDAVFSMDGDFAPLPELFALAEADDAYLVLDDAHGFGVKGDMGKGSLSHFGLEYHPRIILMGTLGKAAGGAGAFIAGSAEVIEWLIQTARSYIFTTAASPAMACALQASLRLIATADTQRQHLQGLIAQLRAGVAGLPWVLLPSETAIQPLIVGENEATLALSQHLAARGIWVPAIRPPTVPKGQSRLRISLSAAHRKEDVDTLIAGLWAAAS